MKWVKKNAKVCVYDFSHLWEAITLKLSCCAKAQEQRHLPGAGVCILRSVIDFALKIGGITVPVDFTRKAPGVLFLCTGFGFCESL